MRLEHIILSLLLLTCGTGCPMWWGKGGFIDRAVRKDMVDRHNEDLPENGRGRTCPDGADTCVEKRIPERGGG